MSEETDKPARSFMPSGDGVLKREHFSAEGLNYYKAELAKIGGSMSDEAREASMKEALATIAPGEDVWIFGYGSLMWNPVIEVAESRVAYIDGFHRVFCLTMAAGRGSKELPGLMLALDEGHACTGIIHRIESAKIETEFALLWNREMLSGAYRPHWFEARTEAGPVRALTFVAECSHPRYEGRLPEEEIVRRLATAAGVLGTNRDYLYRTAAQLAELGIHDDPLHALAAKVRERANEPATGELS